ncbi:MAG: DUF1684 domain-containing protein [Saprospiraceae bacterium]
MKKYFLFFCALFMLSCSTLKRDIEMHRIQYKSDFLTDERSPLKKEDLIHLDFYPPVADGKVKATFTLTPDAEPFDLPTYSGITRSYRKYGIATFNRENKEINLSLYQNMTLISNPAFKDYLFLPFKDETNGVTTYGGGRYLNMSKDDTADGIITIDFNKAYNPWCAYSDGFNCPIPPVENHLSFPVHAGEKSYKGEVHHKSE